MIMKLQERYFESLHIIKKDPELEQLLYGGGWIKAITHLIDLQKLNAVLGMRQVKEYPNGDGLNFILFIKDRNTGKDNIVEFRLFFDKLILPATWREGNSLDNAGGFAHKNITFATRIKLRILRIVFEAYQYFSNILWKDGKKPAIVWTSNLGGEISRN